jgi:hypothetical protein
VPYLLVNGQEIIVKLEYDFQRERHVLYSMIRDYNFRISKMKSKTVAL